MVILEGEVSVKMREGNQGSYNVDYMKRETGGWGEKWVKKMSKNQEKVTFFDIFGLFHILLDTVNSGHFKQR